MRPAGQSQTTRCLLLAGTRRLITLLSILMLSALASAADCIPIHEAGQPIGEVECVVGTRHSDLPL